MKRIIVIALFIILMTPLAYADRWCQWSGTEGIECKNDSNGVLNMPFPTRTESLINAKGYYRVTITQPTIGENQVRDAEVWGFADNQISLTWTVRDLTVTEIDQRIASPMSIEMYWVWKVFLDTGTITQAQAAQRLPAEMIDAYLARKRLLGD